VSWQLESPEFVTLAVQRSEFVNGPWIEVAGEPPTVGRHDRDPRPDQLRGPAPEELDDGRDVGRGELGRIEARDVGEATGAARPARVVGEPLTRVVLPVTPRDDAVPDDEQHVVRLQLGRDRHAQPRPNPKSCWPTLRIWISSEPSVIR